jgi:hypothetical protein
MLIKKNKEVLITSLFLLAVLSSCSHQSWSTRDINLSEKFAIAEYSNVIEREPANWFDKCTAAAKNFLKLKPKDPVVASKPLPELTQLNPEIKKFPNGKKYIQYKANINVMNKYPDYEEFLERTAEIVFEPVEPFGHINLRIGKKIYSFNFIQSTSINNFSPRIKNSSNPELPGSVGYIFEMEKEKILAMEKDIEAFYRSSASNNVPPFDAYAPLLKIHEEVGMFGKKLVFKSDSPKFGNRNAIKGTIVNENGSYYLDAGNGVKVDVIKQGDDDYMTQSYSCSSSAGYIMEKFFGITISYAQSAKALQQSLANGNINQKISPIGVMKYHEE